MRIDDIEAQIVVDGKVADEYADIDFDQEPVEHQASKYIQTVPGASFAMQYQVHEGYQVTPGVTHLTFHLWVDRHRLEARLISKERVKTGDATTMLGQVFKKAAGDWSRHPLRFTSLESYGQGSAPGFHHLLKRTRSKSYQNNKPLLSEQNTTSA
jgi:hypothetical protein